MWDVLHAGGLRAWSALTMQQIADRLQVSTATVHKRVRVHEEALEQSDEYAALAGRLLACAIQEDHQASH